MINLTDMITINQQHRLDRELVYDNKGNNLFFYDFTPDDIIINPEIPEGVSDSTRPIASFEPLTTGTVKKWLGWFLYNLENNRLEIIQP